MAKKKRKKSSKKKKVIGKIFLILLFIAGQGMLAYAIVNKYYPDIYKKINTVAPEEYVTYDMEELVVNPAGTKGKRFLMVEISLEMTGEEHIEMLEGNRNKIQQEMNEALSSRTVDELTRLEAREELRQELIRIINLATGTRSVHNLYFTKYIMQ